MKNMLQRRRFFKTALRTVIGGGLAAGGLTLASRRNPVSETACDEKFICPKCGKNAHCGLPHAQNYREHRAQLDRAEKRAKS